MEIEDSEDEKFKKEVNNLLRLRLSQHEKSAYDVQNLVNSKKVNESFLKNVEEMFELEFDIKMRA